MSYSFQEFGYSIFVLLAFSWPVKSADHDLRIALLPGSHNSGRLEILHGNFWGAICDDEWGMQESKVACRQLGYSNTDGFTPSITGGISDIFLDQVHCLPEHSRIQDCSHAEWYSHDCDSGKNIGVNCSGGNREVLSKFNSKSLHYWSCDNFVPGTEYDFKNGQKVVVHGTASFMTSPINSGFRLQGQSSWVVLGNVFNEQCLLDPSTCALTVSVWLKIFKKSHHHKTYVLGNTFNDTKTLGFTFYIHYKQLRGSVLGKKKHCEFWDYHFTERYWFHFLMTWSPSDNVDLVTYAGGNKYGKIKCQQKNTFPYMVNSKYTLGVDEAMAVDTNRDFDVAYDELAIWRYRTTSNKEIKASSWLSADIGGSSVTEVKVKFADKPWDSSYADSESAAYTELNTNTKQQLRSLYNGNNVYYTTFNIKSLEDGDGVMVMSLQLVFSKIHYNHGYRLERAFYEGTFLNSRAEILDCQSQFEYCTSPVIEWVQPHGSQSHWGYFRMRYVPAAEHFNDPYFRGYHWIARKDNGHEVRKDLYPSSTNAQTIDLHVHEGYTYFTVAVQPVSFRGYGFRCSNLVRARTSQGPPRSGPSYVRVEAKTPFNATVVWGTINSKQNGIIERYLVRVQNKSAAMSDTYFAVNEERKIMIGNLQPGRQYQVQVCGYTAHSECGTRANSEWFRAGALLPSKPPQNVRVVNIEPQSAELKWENVDASGRNGPMVRYEIWLKHIERDTWVRRFQETNLVNEAFYQRALLDLKGLTRYYVNISLVNVVGMGPEASTEFQTAEGVPSEAPGNFTIMDVTSYTIVVGWEALDVDIINGILLGYRIHFKIVNVTDAWDNVTSSNLTAAVPVLSLRTYALRVCGFTAVGDGVCSRSVVTTVSGYKPFNVSTDIRIVSVTNDSMMVEWRFQSPLSSPAQYFVVRAIRNDTNDTVFQETFDALSWPYDIYKLDITDLKEFKWYDIRIAAGNIAGLGPFTYDPVLNRTLEGVPSAPPRNLTAVNMSSTSILLEWKPVSYEYADGIILGHVIFWHQAITSNVWESRLINSTTMTSAVVPNLKKFTDYEFKVFAYNSVGESVTTSPVVARTDEDVPGHPPVNVNCRNTSSRSLLVSWGPVPVQYTFGIVKGYSVSLIDVLSGQSFIHDIPVSNTSLEVIGLKRYTNYSIKVAAFTIKGLGNFSEPLITITDEDVPSDGPPNVVCFHTGSTSLYIKWSTLPVTIAHGIVTAYKIFLHRSDVRDNTSMDVQPSDSRNTTFYNLDEYVYYTVRVLASTIKGDGVKGDPVTCRTDQDVPHSWPQGLYGYNTSDTSVQVFWEEVPRDDQNGIITGYTVFYNTTLRTGEVFYYDQNLGTGMQHILNNLLPYKYYNIQVAASTSKGLGPRSPPATIRTDEEAPKVPPSEVKAFNTSSTSITMTWKRIPPEEVGGILRGYKVMWQEINYRGEIILENETRLDNSSFTMLGFSGLTKYQEYRFSILAFTKYDGVVSSPVSTMTDEDIPSAPPTNCSGFNMSKNEIQVMWDTVPRPHRNGIILGYNIYSDKVLSYFASMPTGTLEPPEPTVVNTTGPLSRSFLLDWLIPYTDYSFQIEAFTSKGEGPKCESFVVRTEEEAPLYAPAHVRIHNTSSTSLNVTWVGLSLTSIRGVFVGYDIAFTAYPQFPEAYLTYSDMQGKRKRRAAFTLDEQIISVGVETETFELTGLAKYTNYSIRVMGLTKFVGADSHSILLLTDEDRPTKTPQNFRGHNTSSTSLLMMWNPVPNGFVHGILLGYRVYYRVTEKPSLPWFNVTLAPTILTTEIHDLFMYTNYTLQITAFTSKGEGPYTEEIVVTTDEDVASKSPFGFKVITLYRTHEIPMSWNPVPEGFLNGILIGYRLKRRQISEALTEIDGKEVHIDLDAETLSYTARNLPNFATYTFQVVALTKYGEGVHSRVITAETCPCEKYLTTNWFTIPPYTNKTEEHESGIFPWLLNNLVTECCGNCRNGHGWSETLYKIDGKGGDAYKYKISEFLNVIDDDTDFSFPVVGHSLKDKYATYFSYVFAISSPGIAFFIVDDPPETVPNAILVVVANSWFLIVFSVVCSLIAGIILWFMDSATNEIEFPKIFHKGAGEGFWWAFVSMTTVGYGDRTPQSIAGRLFTICWVLAGLVIFSILMGTITNALTTVAFEDTRRMLYGTKVAAVDESPSYRVGVRRNAKVNEERTYQNAFEIQSDLLSRKVKGALLDGYMAGSYHELFEDEHISIKEVIDYKSGYGIVLGGQSYRLQKCFNHYLKRKRSYIIDHIAKEVKIVKRNPKSPAEAKSTNLFNPEATIFLLTIMSVGGLFVVAILAGLCLQVYFKRRFRNKVQDSAQANDKQISRELTEVLESFQTRMFCLKVELYNKHINELRIFEGLKRRSVTYDVLPKLKDEPMNFNEIDTIASNNNKRLFTPSDKSVAKADNELEPIESSMPSPTRSTSTASLLPRSVPGSDHLSDNLDGTSESTLKDASGRFPEIKLPNVNVSEVKPDIEDLKREAYLAGLRAKGQNESGHPYAKMYRYLWVEMDDQ